MGKWWGNGGERGETPEKIDIKIIINKDKIIYLYIYFYCYIYNYYCGRRPFSLPLPFLRPFGFWSAAAADGAGFLQAEAVADLTFAVVGRCCGEENGTAIDPGGGSKVKSKGKTRPLWLAVPVSVQNFRFFRAAVGG